MRNLQDTFEDFFGNVGSTPEDNKRRKIEAWMKKFLTRYNYGTVYGTDYTIDTDGKINFWHSLKIWDYPEKELPDYINFGLVEGCLEIYQTQRTTLRGCPENITSYFYCECNDNLTNLEYCPKVIRGDLQVGYCPNLVSLKGAPKRISGNLWCENLPKLKDIGDIKIIRRSFYCRECPLLFDIKDEIKSITKRNLQEY